MATRRDGSMSNSFCIACLLLIPLIFITLHAEQFSDAQVTITPGIDDEPEPEPEAEPIQQPNSGPGKVFQALDYAHFVPLTNSPGNQVKLMLNYSVADPAYVGELMSGSMKVYAANNDSLIRIPPCLIL
jgi:hypothetical protein